MLGQRCRENLLGDSGGTALAKVLTALTMLHILNLRYEKITRSLLGSLPVCCAIFCTWNRAESAYLSY